MEAWFATSMGVFQRDLLGAVHILPHHGPGGVGVRENMMKYDGFVRGGGGRRDDDY